MLKKRQAAIKGRPVGINSLCLYYKQLSVKKVFFNNPRSVVDSGWNPKPVGGWGTALLSRQLQF